MTTWPTSPTFVTTSVDAGTDDPAVARAEIKKLMDDVANMEGALGTASGPASLDSGAKLPLAQLPVTPISGAAPVVLTVGSGTWIVPAGVTRIKATVVGGGGGGGYTSIGTGGDHGGGGGAGAVAIKHFTVVPGDVFNYTVGAKGVGHSAASDGDGTNGGNSTLQSPGTSTPASYTVTGGGGLGGLGPAGSRFGGGGGAPINADIALNGGAGVSGASRGGAGASNALTGGCAGATGYGGGGGFGSGGGTPAFDGFDGVIIIEY